MGLPKIGIAASASENKVGHLTANIADANGVDEVRDGGGDPPSDVLVVTCS